MQDALEVLVHGQIIRKILDLNLAVSSFQPQNASINATIDSNATSSNNNQHKALQEVDIKENNTGENKWNNNKEWIIPAEDVIKRHKIKQQLQNLESCHADNMSIKVLQQITEEC